MADLEILENPSQVDWAALHDLLHRTYAYMDTRIDPPSSLHRLTPQGLAQKAQDETLILAMDGDRLVGCMFCRRQPGWLYVGKVAVEEAMQGQGVGGHLFRRAFDLARREGFEGLELETRIELVENHQAFANMGFVKVGEDAHASYDQPTSIRMRAALQ
ncbi:MAG: GNAT family N-acetyltransferase [Rhizobiaceae bacterium]